MTPRHAFLFVAALAVAGCNGRGHSSLAEPAGVERRPSLRAATGCGELETAIEDALVLQMRSQVQQIREGWGGWIAIDGGLQAGAPVPAGASPAGGPQAYTTTNSQVAGVDEADFLQNDGSRMAVLAGGRLHLVRSWPAESLAEASSLPIEGWPSDLFLSGNQAVVFSRLYVPIAAAQQEVACPALGCGRTWPGQLTKVTLVDVSDLAAPRVTAEIYLPGRYLAARRIGPRVRLVMDDELPLPEGVSYWPDGAGTGANAEAFDALQAKNEALIRARSLDDWLRRGTVRRADGSEEELGYACGDFALGNAPVRPGLLTLATLDLDRQALVSRTAVLGQADVVYASKDTLYAAASHWWWWPKPGQADATYLHAFDLRDPDRAEWLGSGVADGQLTSQYQLDEFQGKLRVATTLRTRVEGPDPWGRLELANQLTVLGLSGGALQTVGRTAPFGKDETLFGTRFLGARGFAITARQVDPLFTFDLSDPQQPRVVGALEMPGFIAYLHPIDDTHLLGVGREPATAGGPMQLKVQLLDVADLARPRSLSLVTVGEAWGWSESLWDPKAFTWFPERGLLAIPFVDFGQPELVSDLRLFRVDAALGIAPAGRLPMGDVFATASGPGWSTRWSPWVRRGVLADDFVYGVTDGGVRSARVSELPAWLRTVEFGPPLP